MSTLKDLVPPLELCKRIPAGAFGDSAMVWALDCGDGSFVQDRIVIKRALYGRIICPAPTLAEIFAKLPQTASVTWFTQEEYPNSYAVGCYILQRKPRKVKRIVEIDDNPATAALRLWLTINKTQPKER